MPENITYCFMLPEFTKLHAERQYLKRVSIMYSWMYVLYELQMAPMTKYTSCVFPILGRDCETGQSLDAATLAYRAFRIMRRLPCTVMTDDNDSKGKRRPSVASILNAT